MIPAWLGMLNQMRLCFTAVLNKGNVLKSHFNRVIEATLEIK